MAIQLVFWMIIVFVIIQDASAQESSLAMPGCQPKCGNISIPYPFGIGADCSGHYNFSITCDSSSTPPRPFLVKYKVEVLEISIHEGTLSYRDQYSCTKNYDNFTDMEWSTDWKWSTKYWKCDDRLLPKTNNRSFGLCGENTQCSREGLCYCKYGYDGNPYLLNGCEDIDECSPQNENRYYFNSNWDRSVHNRCSQGCINEEGDHSCYCLSGYKSDGDGRWCYPEAPDNKTRNAIIGTCSGIGGLILLGITWWLYKLLQRRKEKKLKEKFFKKNGGLLLQQEISSSHEGNVEKSKIFTSKELEKATDHYNKDRILGQGGQGTVYKGMLTDGRIVAVKKSKIKNESELEPFINEVVILSKIDQRNIVKLHGYCLETEVPLLVYEFIPNGTLFQYIHEQNEDFPLSWDVRIRIAKEVAGALFYLHSSASIPIYHRDIKSTNILLDEKYRAKVADFGTSRSTTIDQTHLTTPAIQGTFGYLDPEYFQSSHFTDKSDVYSFGVVLVELLTGQKPILSDRSEVEGRSLATFFKLAMEQDRLFDILDPRVMKDGRKEEILGLANLAHRCLNLNGRKRPTMRQVVVEFEGISLPIGTASPHQHYDEVQYAATELMGPWETTSTSMESSTIYSTSIDVEPLLHAPS